MSHSHPVAAVLYSGQKNNHVMTCFTRISVCVCGLSSSRIMDTIISLMLHPRLTTQLASGNESGWFDPVYPLALFFAFGIYTVVQKYHKKQNSPIPFQYSVPEVCLYDFSPTKSC